MSGRMPLHLVWALTNACNVKCVHCYASSARRSPGELTFNEIIHQIEILARDGLLDLALSGGEPLLLRNLERIIEHAASSGLTVGVGTNGWALTQKRAKTLAESGVSRIQISLDGLAETHDRVRRRIGLFRKAQQAIYNSRRAGISTKVCFTVHRDNWQELPDLFEYALTLGVDGFNLSQLVPTGRGKISMDLGPNEWKRILEWWNKMRLAHPEVRMTTHLAQVVLVAPEISSYPSFKGCQAGDAQGAISATGDVYPCVVLPYSVGNIRNSSIKQIWSNSPDLKMIRDRSRLKGACGSCPVKEKCGGCRAVAYALTGDLSGEDKHCWRSQDRVLS